MYSVSVCCLIILKPVRLTEKRTVCTLIVCFAILYVFIFKIFSSPEARNLIYRQHTQHFCPIFCKISTNFLETLHENQSSRS